MNNPYINTYENDNGDIVLVYLPEVKPFEQVTPECIVLNRDHVESICESILVTLRNSEL